MNELFILSFTDNAELRKLYIQINDFPECLAAVRPGDNDYLAVCRYYSLFFIGALGGGAILLHVGACRVGVRLLYFRC